MRPDKSGNYDGANGHPRRDLGSGLVELQAIYDAHYDRAVELLGLGLKPREITYDDPDLDRPVEAYKRSEMVQITLIDQPDRPPLTWKSNALIDPRLYEPINGHLNYVALARQMAAWAKELEPFLELKPDGSYRYEPAV